MILTSIRCIILEEYAVSKNFEELRPFPDFEEYVISTSVDTSCMILWSNIKKNTFSANTPYPRNQYSVLVNTPYSKNQYSVLVNTPYPKNQYSVLVNTPYPKNQYSVSEDPIHRIGQYAVSKNRIWRTVFRFPPYPFNYPTRRLTIEEMLAKFIDEGKREHEEMEIFIIEFRTTNELLLKERSNLSSELEIKVNELSKVMGNVLIPKNKVKRVTTRGGNMAFSKEINETGINKNKPPRFEQDVQEKPHDDGVENKSSIILEKTTQPLVKPQQSSIPFPNRVRKEKEEAL
ncbi:hypothetical protein Tco_1162302 [Tanacetum coccineum]